GRVRPMLGRDLVQAVGHEIQRLVPGGLAQRAALVVADHGLRQAVGVVDKAVDIPALDAQPAVADGMALDRERVYQPAVEDLQIDAAAGAAIGARGQYVLVFHGYPPCASSTTRGGRSSTLLPGT